jgi:hypothetical protein
LRVIIIIISLNTNFLRLWLLEMVPIVVVLHEFTLAVDVEQLARDCSTLGHSKVRADVHMHVE